MCLGWQLVGARRRSFYHTAAKVTQAALAEASGVGLATVSRAERTGRVSLAHFVAMANALDLRLGLQRPPPDDEFDEVFSRPRSEPPRVPKG